MVVKKEYTEHDRWRDDNGEELRHTFQLDENSVVYDIGGYKGDWSAHLFSKYRCNIFIFEPVKFYFRNILARFKYHSSKITCYNVALSDDDGKTHIYLNGDESTMHGSGENSTEILRISFNYFVYGKKFVWMPIFYPDIKRSPIDLMKINIEGEEYGFLAHIISIGEHKNIKGILVQFHRNIEDYENKYKTIAEELSKTHELKFRYAFIWEYWEIKK